MKTIALAAFLVVLLAGYAKADAPNPYPIGGTLLTAGQPYYEDYAGAATRTLSESDGMVYLMANTTRTFTEDSNRWCFRQMPAGSYTLTLNPVSGGRVSALNSTTWCDANAPLECTGLAGINLCAKRDASNHTRQLIDGVGSCTCGTAP